MEPTDVSISSCQRLEELLRHVEPCRFPVLDDGIRVPKQEEEVAIRLTASRFSIASFYNKYGHDMAELLATAWAVVLGSYAGSPDVCFGVLTQDSKTREASVGLAAMHLNSAESVDTTIRATHRLTLANGRERCTVAELELASGSLPEPVFNTMIHLSTVERESYRIKGVSVAVFP